MFKKIGLLTLIISFSLTIGGCKKENPVIDGVQGPTVTQVDDGLLISAVLKNVAIDIGIRIPVPRFPMSYVELSPDLETGGTLVAAFVSAEDISEMLGGGFEFLDQMTLPGGRALPGVQGGTLPGIAFNVDVLLDTSFYIGPKVYGIFIPVNLNLAGNIITKKFYKDSNPIGNISIVSNDETGENGGILLLLTLDKVLKEQLETIENRKLEEGLL